MSTPTEPQIQLPSNWQEIAKRAVQNRQAVSVSQEEIGAALKWLQNSKASSAQVLRPAQKGDLVEVDFEVSAEGRKIADGESRNHSLVLGEGGYIPGFEDALAGLEAGEGKNFSLDAPMDYWKKELAGKRLDFHAKMKSVKSRMLPALDDDFARSAGKFENLAALEKSVGEGIRLEKEEKEKQRTRLLMLAMIDDKTEIQVPEQYLKDELKTMMMELEGSLAAAGLPLEDYLKQIKRTAEELAEDFRPEAVRRVRYALILRQIAREAGIEPTEEEVKVGADQILLKFSSQKDAARKIDSAGLFRYTRNILRNEKTFQHLEQVAAKG